MPEVATAPATQRLHVAVELAVTHRVVVTLDADSGHTMEELKQKALEEFHRDPRNHRNGQRSDDLWRMQFSNRSNISVGEEQATIAAVNTVPRDGKSW